MKKHILYTTLALVAIWGCAKVSEIDVIPKEDNPQETTETLPEGTHVATLSCGTEQDNPDVKGTFVTSGEHLAFQWQEGDEIGVYMYGVGGGEYNAWIGPFTLDKGAGTGNGEFTRVLQNYEDFGNVAIYPYTSGSSFNYGTNTLTFNLPAKYENLDNLDMIRMPMVGVLDMSDYGAHKNTFEFKHVGGVVKFTLKDVPAKAKYFKMWTVGKRVSGNFTINLSTVGTQALQTENTDSDNNTVEMQLKQGRAVDELDVYFPVPAGTYRLGIGVYGDGITYLEKTASKENTVDRGRILKMPAITIPEPNLGAYVANEFITTPSNKASGLTYQLNVFSFADSDGNGKGDFLGIKNHLDYLDNLGVTAIWLSPCQEAQSYHGYDVTDYTALNHEYASASTPEGRTSAKAKEDFQELINAAHAHNIRIYMDYVINHTGDKHPWFLDVKEKGPASQYWNYYAVSADPYNDIHQDKIPQIPTNWDINPKTDNRFWPFYLRTGDNSIRYAFELDWSNASSPSIKVYETNEEVTTSGDYNNSERYLFWGDSQYTKFVDNGTNKYRLVLDYLSDWGCLVRTTDDHDDWSDGTKWGFASSKDQLVLGVSHDLTSNNCGNIYTPDGTLYYYYSAFSTGMMPDINYGHANNCENSPAFQAILASIDEWLDMGLDGLRLDAIKHIYGNESGGEGSENRTFWQKFYSAVNTKYQAKVAKRSNLDGVSDTNIFMVGEVLSGEDDCRPFYAGLPAIFEFQFWWDLRTALKSDSSKGSFVSNMIDRYYRHQEVRGDAIATPKLANHDEDRTASELYEMHRIRQAGAILLTAPGRPFIYQGEELGYWGASSMGGDEYRRAPILWTTSISSAACAGVDNKIPEGMLTPSISVQSQAANDESLLTLYRRFGYARNKNEAMALGKPVTDEKNNDDGVMSWYMKYWRSEELGDKVCLVMHNITGNTKTVERYDGENLSTILVASDPIRVDGKYVTLPPYSSVVFALN